MQKLLKASGLTYTMHSAGTTVEGSWDEVMRVIGQAHSVVHQVGPQRIQTSMRVGTRSVSRDLGRGAGLNADFRAQDGQEADRCRQGQEGRGSVGGEEVIGGF